jgi:hypothetical protein
MCDTSPWLTGYEDYCELNNNTMQLPENKTHTYAPISECEKLIDYLVLDWYEFRKSDEEIEMKKEEYRRRLGYSILDIPKK